MFTITIYELGNKSPIFVKTTILETLAETEVFAIKTAEWRFGIIGLELVYIDDLDYYVETAGLRIGRLTIKPLYIKKGARK